MAVTVIRPTMVILRKAIHTLALRMAIHSIPSMLRRGIMGQPTRTASNRDTEHPVMLRIRMRTDITMEASRIILRVARNRRRQAISSAISLRLRQRRPVSTDTAANLLAMNIRVRMATLPTLPHTTRRVPLRCRTTM